MNHLDKLSDEELVKYANKRMPVYRRLMSRAKSFLTGLLGRGVMRATAGDYTIDVGGDGEVRGAGKIRLSNFKAPSFTKLKQHVTALQESDALDELTYIVNRLNSSESKVMKAEAKRMYPMLQAMMEAFNTSMEALERIADKHVPVEVANVFQDAAKITNAIMAAYAEEENVDLLANVLVGSNDDRIDFVQYFDVTEYTENRLFVIVTCSLTAVGNEYVMSRHVTVQDRFQAPFSYDVGEATTDITKSVKTALATHGVIAAIGALTLKIDETRIKRALSKLDFVKSVEFAPKAISVYVKGNKKTFDQEKEIFAVLSADTDIRRMLGRSKRLISKFTEDKFWQFTVNSQG